MGSGRTADLFEGLLEVWQNYGVECTSELAVPRGSGHLTNDSVVRWGSAGSGVVHGARWKSCS